MFIGHKDSGEELLVPSSSLTTHVAVLGSTGSGKSGLILNMTEELHKEGVPVILVDIKGDMVNIALQKEYVPVQCITPGGSHGEPINILADLQDPDKSSVVVSAILAMVGENPDPMNSRAHAYLSTIIEDVSTPSLYDLIIECQDPSVEYIGAMHVDDAFPKATRLALARKLNTLLVSPSFDAWQQGGKLDLDSIVDSKGITIYSVAHLVNKEEQNFAISFLANEVLQWTKRQAGSKEVRLIMGIDECIGLLPPYPANPPTKEPILRLLKQARAFGVGMVLGTQNPVDIDYKALSNCNTWFVGRMTANRDRSKVVAGMTAAGLADERTVNTWIPRLKPREFIVSTHDRLEVFKTRDSSCTLQGPMVQEEIVDLYDRGYLTFMQKVAPADVIVKEVKKERRFLEAPTVPEAFIGLTILGVFGYFLLQVLEVAANFLKGL